MYASNFMKVYLLHINHLNGLHLLNIKLDIIQILTYMLLYIFAFFNEKDKPALTGVICALKLKAIINRIRKGTDIEQTLLRAISPCKCWQLKPN